MAERKTTNRTSSKAVPRTSAKKRNVPKKKPIGVLFGLAFVIVIAGLFVVNREIINRNIESTGIFHRLLNGGTPSAETAPEDVPQIVETIPADNPAAAVPPPAEPQTALPQVHIETITPPASTIPETVKPETPPAAVQAPPREYPPETKPPAESRDRSLYLMKLDNDGTIVRTKVSRSLPVSNSPMMDALNALLQGPNADERNKGLVSLIPEETEVLSATVRGSTAYISFSENFQFNTYGVEGYAAQLRQIVWTVTEFPNVNDVQILLEGRRIDYLGEGIWIGSPLSREAL